MENAIYYNPTKIIFGKDTERSVGKEAAKHAKKVLVHYGGSSAVKSGLIDRVKQSLEGAGVAYVELGGVQSNPRLALVREGIALCRESNVELVLAVGGGSVIDSAKAIAANVPNAGDDVWDYYTGKATPAKTLPVATILTIPGAGSESSTGSVITNDDTMEKLALDIIKNRPVFSILNPELTYTVPAYHTAAGVVDAIAHVMERYFTNTTDCDLTDRFCESTIRDLVKYGPAAVHDPYNYTARSAVMWACKMAHDGTLGFGREEDWGSHMIEHELSAKYDVSHGAGLAVVFPAWMKYVYAHRPELFAQFAMRVFDVEYCFEDPAATILQGIESLACFFAALGMPTTLRDLGIADKAALDEMAQKAAEHGGGTLGHFMELTATDIRNILELAY